MNAYGWIGQVDHTRPDYRIRPATHWLGQTPHVRALVSSPTRISFNLANGSADRDQEAL